MLMGYICTEVSAWISHEISSLYMLVSDVSFLFGHYLFSRFQLVKPMKPSKDCSVIEQNWGESKLSYFDN